MHLHPEDVPLAGGWPEVSASHRRQLLLDPSVAEVCLEYFDYVMGIILKAKDS